MVEPLLVGGVPKFQQMAQKKKKTLTCGTSPFLAFSIHDYLRLFLVVGVGKLVASR